MAYEMRDFRYAEYVRFCEDKGITPVAYEQYTARFLWAFCKEHQIPNSIWDLGGAGWCELPEPDYTHRAAPQTDPALLKVARNILARIRSNQTLNGLAPRQRKGKENV